MSRELPVHVVERVIGDAQSEQHLLADIFGFTALLRLTLFIAAIDSQRGQNAQRY